MINVKLLLSINFLDFFRLLPAIFLCAYTTSLSGWVRKQKNSYLAAKKQLYKPKCHFFSVLVCLSVWYQAEMYLTSVVLTTAIWTSHVWTTVVLTTMPGRTVFLTTVFLLLVSGLLMITGPLVTLFSISNKNLSKRKSWTMIIFPKA